MKIEIRSRSSGEVIFAIETENWRLALEAAVKSGADLRGADLRGLVAVGGGPVSDKFILEGHTPVRCDDLLRWGRWLQTANRRVAEDFVGEVRIRTIFLGLNPNDWPIAEPPLLFETMVFGGPLDQSQDRSRTWEEAEATHKHWIEKARRYDRKD